MRVMRALWGAAAILVSPVAPAMAGEVTVVAVEVVPSMVGGFDFHVTLQHEDTGWDHYAIRWEVTSLSGNRMFGERVLFHPHVNEQPFTRSLRAIVIPPDVREVLVRGQDKVHGWGEPVQVRLPGR